MRLTVFFESWFIPDGTYSPMHVGQLVNLAFQIRPDAWHTATREQPGIESRDDGTCAIRGTVTWIQPPVPTDTVTWVELPVVDATPVAVLDAGNFRAYVEDEGIKEWTLGSFIVIEGDLNIDYYIWSEFLADEYPDAPNLFYSFRVTRIRRIWIPESFVGQSETGLSSPTSVPLSEVPVVHIVDVESMLAGDDSDVASHGPTSLHEYRPHFFLVDLADDNLPDEVIPRSFH